MPYSVDTSIIKKEIAKAISTGETQQVKYKDFYFWIVPSSTVSCEIILANGKEDSKDYHYDNNGVFVNMTIYNPIAH